jgi:hypothetical protein
MGAQEEVSMGAPEEVGMGVPEKASPVERTIRDGLVAASLGAGVIHIWAAWAHSNQIAQLVFFLAVATLQVWWATVVLWVRGAPWSVLVGGAAANAAVVVVWVLSRTTSLLPFIPKVQSMDDVINQAGKGSPLHPVTGTFYHAHLKFGLADTTASLLEIALIVGVILLARMRRGSGVVPGDSP